MTLSDSIEICEDNIREQIQKAIDTFRSKYSNYPNFLVMSNAGYLVLKSECTGMNPEHETDHIIKSYMGMDLLMTVKNDMLFELI